MLQLDFVNVLIPAQYLVVWSRLGHYDTGLLDDYLYRSGNQIEHWAHEACSVPVELWPLLQYRRAGWQPWGNNPGSRLPDAAAYLENALEQVRLDGALTADELPQIRGPARKPGDWHRSVARRALEHHFGCGRLAVRERRANFQRVYDLPERIIPGEYLEREIEEPEARRELLAYAGSRLGIATLKDLADYFRMTMSDVAPRVAELVDQKRLVPVQVEGWQEPAWLSADASPPGEIRGASLHSPFDPLLWCRPRVERLFGFHYRLEIYLPKKRRKWGYYVLPFRVNDEIVARVDLKADRKASVLLVQQAHPEEGVDAGLVASLLAKELRALANWLQLARVQVRCRKLFCNQIRAEIKANVAA